MKKLLISASFILATTLSNMASADQKFCISVNALSNGKDSAPAEFIDVCTKHCTAINMSYSTYNTDRNECHTTEGPQFECSCQ